MLSKNAPINRSPNAARLPREQQANVYKVDLDHVFSGSLGKHLFSFAAPICLRVTVTHINQLTCNPSSLHHMAGPENRLTLKANERLRARRLS